jgi:hypothetical protein
MLACLLTFLSLPPPQSATAFVGATVIDGMGAPPQPDCVMVTRGNRIAAVGSRSSTPIPADAKVVDIHGKWIVPGLIDMHVHLDEDLSPSAFTLFGVTSVRDCGSRLVTTQKLRTLSARGVPMPRIYWLGRNIDEGTPSWWGAVAVKGPKEVPALLADMARQGVDGVKLYTLAGPRVAKAVIAEAHRRGWPVTGHLDRTRPSEAAEDGIDNLEHVFTLFNDLRPRPPNSVTGYRRQFYGLGNIDLEGPAAQKLNAVLKRRLTAVTATLAVSTLPLLGELGACRSYGFTIPPGWSRYWKSSYWRFISTAGWNASDFAMARAAQAKLRELVRRLDRAGVPILAGTDSPAPWVLPGAGLVQELEMLVESGLSPMSAIQAATGRAAHALHRDADLGTVRAGRFADFVVLDADPLADIHNLRKINQVFMGGVRLDRDRIRHEFEAAHEPPPGKP